MNEQISSAHNNAFGKYIILTFSIILSENSWKLHVPISVKKIYLTLSLDDLHFTYKIPFKSMWWYRICIYKGKFAKFFGNKGHNYCKIVKYELSLFTVHAYLQLYQFATMLEQ